MHDPNHGVTILPSTAPGVFGTPVQLAPSGIPYVAQAVVVGRFGSDAHLDVALQNLSSAWLFRGLGGLAFAPAQPLPPAATFGAGAFTADLDVDGWDEIVSGTTVVRFQASGQVDGSVGYGIAASGGRVGDVLDADGNGFPDLVGSAPNELLLKILVNRSGPQVLDAPPPAPNRSSLLLRAVANPCRERFELQLGGASGPVQLALYDIHGRRLRETRVEGTTGGIVRADLGSTHGLAPGVYLAMARQEDSRATIRLTLLR
jgi:hypothetical protein